MMRKTIGAAALLGVISAAVVVPHAMAQCVSPVMIKFDADVYAYESSYNLATLMSSTGSNLTVVGKIVCFGPPLAYLNANMPAKEYTFVWNLVTQAPGTVQTIPGRVWNTDYASASQLGTFAIYEDAAPNAPNACAVAAFPPNADVPGKFIDGSTVILNGTIDYFHTQVTKATNGSYGGSFNATYKFTGGTLYGAVGGASSNLNGLWCTIGTGTNQCMIPCNYVPPPASGYSAHPSGKYDAPSSTPAVPTTWSVIQQLYR
jgi:hypothetical protein